MEQFDREKARRVWQRVQNQPGEERLPANPEGLLLEELTDLRLLGQLALQQKSPLLRELISRTQNRVDTLRGICRLSGLTVPSNLPKLPATPFPTALRRLMGFLLRRQLEYHRLAEHPEYGCLYEGLSEQTKASSLMLAKLIGQ